MGRWRSCLPINPGAIADFLLPNIFNFIPFFTFVASTAGICSTADVINSKANPLGDAEMQVRRPPIAQIPKGHKGSSELKQPRIFPVPVKQEVNGTDIQQGTRGSLELQIVALSFLITEPVKQDSPRELKPQSRPCGTDHNISKLAVLHH